jgi:hypothetical protein
MRRLIPTVLGLSIVSITVGMSTGAASTQIGRGTSVDRTTQKQALVLKLTLPNGNWFRVYAIEGEMISYKNLKDGSTFGFAPVVQGETKTMVELTVFQISELEGYRTFQPVESLEVSLGSLTSTGTNPSFNIELERVIKLPLVSKNARFKPISYLTTQGSSCCVECEGGLVCGCAVQCRCSCCTTDRCPLECSPPGDC